MKETTTMPTYAPVTQSGDALYVHVTSAVSPAFWLTLRLKALSVLTQSLTESTDKDESEMLAAVISEMTGECYAFASYCDNNHLFG
jgi:hypothetical protein